MSVDLWISVLLAIPLAIAANLLTPKIGAWLSKLSETTRHRKKELSRKQRLAEAVSLKAQLERIRLFHNDRSHFTEYLLIVLIQIAFFSAVAGVYGGIFSFAGEWDGILGAIGRSGAQLVTLFVSVFIFQISFRAIQTRKRVRDFDAYEKATLETIANLEKD